MDDVETDPPLFGYEWNERDPFPDELRDLLVTITCLDPKTLHPTQIGTGMIMQAHQDRALVLTAAHVITNGVHVFQNLETRQRAHPTTPRDFLSLADVSAASHALRAIVQNGARTDFCRVAFVVWDDAADLAILAIVPQGDEPSDFFQWRMLLSAHDPSAGDLVVVCGFADFDTEIGTADAERSTLSCRPVMRVGKVTEIHTDGTIWVRSKCVEISAPTFSGMSGGPAFLFQAHSAEPLVFGLLSQSLGGSSDPREFDADAWDRSKATRPSMLAVLPRRITPLPDGGQMVKLDFTVSGKAINDEIDPARFADDLSWTQKSPGDDLGSHEDDQGYPPELPMR